MGSWSHRIQSTCIPLLALTLWVGGTDPASAGKPAPDLSAGEAAYAQQCARCHGASGRGDGVDAKRFYPRPRDLSLGVYKFRSTASGTPPTDEDLFQTISNGLPGSNMPDFQFLDERVRWHLVAYLKSLSPVFTQVQPMPVAVTDGPGPSRADRAKGRTLYEQLGCAACHGISGRANGTSAAGLVDDWGMMIRPANLTQGWSYRGGSDPRSVMLRLLAGIDGAGMPSYAEAISAEDAWHLAYYVASLQEPPHWNRVTHALRINGSLPTTLEDPRWAAAERTEVRVSNAVNAEGEWALPPTVKAVSVAAIVHEEAITFQFSWDDPTQDTGASPDGFALLLKPAGSQGDVVTLQAWPSVGGPPLDLCYWSAATGEIREAVSRDFERVIARADPHLSQLSGVARYADGRWQLVLQRPLHPHVPEGASVLTPGTLTSIAVAVWDGGNPDLPAAPGAAQAGARAVSAWIDVVLRTPQEQAGSNH